MVTVSFVYLAAAAAGTNLGQFKSRYLLTALLRSGSLVSGVWMYGVWKVESCVWGASMKLLHASAHTHKHKRDQEAGARSCMPL